MPWPGQGKNVHQGGFGQYNNDNGTWRNDNFTQGGAFNQNIASGGWGNDFFNMGGFGNINKADGGAGNDVFHVGGGFGNQNYIDGGSGYDTVKFEGAKSDYFNYTDQNGVSHYYNMKTNTWTHLKDVENIQFSQPNKPPFPGPGPIFPPPMPQPPFPGPGPIPPPAIDPPVQLLYGVPCSQNGSFVTAANQLDQITQNMDLRLMT
jgi:hypothetical protein